IIGGYARADVILKKAQSCDFSANYAAILNSTIRTIDNKQYINAVLTLTLALDNNIRSMVEVKMITGRNSVHLFDINEKKSCDALHKYMGEFIYEFERNDGLIPGMCPIPKIEVEIITERNSIDLFDINEKKSCDALHKFMGEFIYELERNAGLIPELCPIPMHVIAFAEAHTLVKKWEHCNASADYDFVSNLTFTTTGDKQFADGLILFKIPFDDTNRVHVTVDIRTGRTFRHLMDINETKVCEACHKYFGEFAYEAERNAQLIPKMCHNQKYFIKAI
ncbi:hypothetical protein ILUMI_08353, partial [Ignelater luminosus]